MLTGKQPKFKELYIGMWLSFKKECAAAIDSQFKKIAGDFYDFKEGIYYVSAISINNVLITGGTDDPYGVVDICHEHDDPDCKESHIPIVVNEAGDIIMGVSISISNGYSVVFFSSQELINANVNNFNCMACGNKLNVFSVNFKSCKNCEQKLS